MKKVWLLTGLLLVLGVFDCDSTELYIIANIESENITSAEKRDVRDIFMGNNTDLNLTPVALMPNSKARDIFNTKIVGLTESRIQSYWAQMRFSGRKKPPREFESVEEMLIFVKNNKQTIAYVPAGTDIPENLLIIYRVD